MPDVGNGNTVGNGVRMHIRMSIRTPAVSYFRSGRSGLALGVFIRPPTSSFIYILYHICSTY